MIRFEINNNLLNILLNEKSVDSMMMLMALTDVNY